MRFIVRVSILAGGTLLRLLLRANIDRSGTMCPRSVPLFVHFLPVVLDLIISDGRNLFQYHVMIDVLYQAELAKHVWFLGLVKDVLHYNIINLVGLSHLFEGASSFLLLWLRLYLI